MTHYKCACELFIEKTKKVYCKGCHNFYCVDCVKTRVHICTLGVNIKKVPKNEIDHIKKLIDDKINELEKI